jgi:hypothetical protein
VGHDLTPQGAAFRRAMFYDVFGHNPQRSRSKARLLATVGDSNEAGYKCLGRNGWEKQAQALLPNNVCWANFGVEGSTILPNPAGGPAYANTIGLMDHSVCRALARAKGDCGLIISSVGNDFGLSPQPTASDVFNGHLTVIAKARAANPNVQIFVCTGTTHFGSPYTALQASTNTLIRDGAAGNNYTLIDFAANSQLAQNPGPAFVDNNHMGEFGHGIAAGLVNTVVRSRFGWLN